ncbi:MAG: hypothetical protein ACR2NO_09050 [Chloroflexota bacterium]
MTARAAALRRHWPLLVVLAAGLAFRLPHTSHGHYEDILNYSRVATWFMTPGEHLNIYHNAYPHAFPYAHPPLGPIVFAPFNSLALQLGLPFVGAFHYLMYAFEAAATVFIYLLARRYAAPSDVVVPTVVAAFWFLGSVSALWLGAVGAPPDSNFTSMSAALILAGLWRQQSPGQAGLFYGLALATRTEASLLALPWTLHYLNRSWTAAARFAGVAVVICGSVVAPFFFRDPVAFDFAVRGHIVDRLSKEVPVIWGWLEGIGHGQAARALGPYNSLIMLALILAVPVVFRRDPWLERSLLLVGMTHMLVMPVLHMRYVLYAFGIGMAYAARARVPHLLVLWSLVAMREGLTLLTVGPLWLGLAWQSARAPHAVSDRHDPVRARSAQWLSSASVWRIPALAGVTTALVGLVWTSAEPRVEEGMLKLLGLYVNVPGSAGGGVAAAVLSRAVAFVPLGTVAWRINAIPVLLTATFGAGAGALAGWAWSRQRSRTGGHVVAAVVSVVVIALLAPRTGMWPAPPDQETYRSLVLANLEQLDGGAVICVDGQEAGLWTYAQKVQGMRLDVSVVRGSSAECAELALKTFGGSPMYLSRLADEARQLPLVFFPARGVWRAVSRRPQLVEGAVLKGPDERIYLLQDGRRRWISSLEAFTALGLQWDQVQLASYEALNALPEGSPVG